MKTVSYITKAAKMRPTLEKDHAAKLNAPEVTPPPPPVVGGATVGSLMPTLWTVTVRLLNTDFELREGVASTLALIASPNASVDKTPVPDFAVSRAVFIAAALAAGTVVDVTVLTVDSS